MHVEYQDIDSLNRKHGTRYGQSEPDGYCEIQNIFVR